MGDPNYPGGKRPSLVVDNATAYPFGWSLENMDVTAFCNLREWLMVAVEAKGAKVTGSGIGLGQVDVDIQLDGRAFVISARPIK